MNKEPKFADLLGKTLTAVTGEVGGDEMVFTTNTGDSFRLYHQQDCCESVTIEDICGDLADLVGSPIVQADEAESDKPEGLTREYEPESETWTFYRIATAKGLVVVRWFGESNGYYGESVDFAKCN